MDGTNPPPHMRTIIAGSRDMNPPQIRITNDFLEGNKGRGWNRDQIELLGIEWPPRHGWKLRVIGKMVDRLVAERFAALKDTELKARRRARTPEEQLKLPI